MSEGRSSFGLIALILVMAVVLILTAKAWQKFGPAAIDVSNPEVISDGGQPEAAATIRSSDTPNLKQTQESTDAHAEQVQEAMDAIE